MKYAVSDDALKRLTSFMSHGRVDSITEAAQAALYDFARHDPERYSLGLAVSVASKTYGIDQSEVARKVRELQEEEAIMKEVGEEERERDMHPYTYDPDLEETDKEADQGTLRKEHPDTLKSIEQKSQESYQTMREDWELPFEYEVRDPGEIK